MNKEQLVARIAKKSHLPKSRVALVLDEVANVAYKEIKKGFTIPGVGRIKVVAHELKQHFEMTFNPSRKLISKVIPKASSEETKYRTIVIGQSVFDANKFDENIKKGVRAYRAGRSKTLQVGSGAWKKLMGAK